MLNRLLKNERGAALPLVVILLVVLLGFTAIVVDAGSLYIERRSMVTAADSGALAGAKELIISRGLEDEVAKTNARVVAKNMAIKNGADPMKINVIIENREITIPETGEKDNRQVIEVIVANNKELTFARVLGFNDTDVRARAVATWGYVKKVNGGDILPLFLTDTAYNADEGILHDGKVMVEGNTAGGNWGYIDIEKNWPTLQELLAGTKKTTHSFYIGEVIESESGKRQSVDAPIIDRINAAALLPTKEERRQYMLGLVPIIDEVKLLELSLDDKGKLGNPLKLPIKFFAAYEIEDIVTDYKKNQTAPNSTGYSEALDKPDYISENGAKKYTDYEKGTIVGEFTDDNMDLNEVMIPGDQIDPNPGKLKPATYFKLIE